MSNSRDGKPAAGAGAGAIGLAAAMGLAGAGRAGCGGAAVVAREASLVGHAAPMLAREGALVGAGAHAAGAFETAGASLAREGSHLGAGAGLAREGSHLGAGVRAAEGVESGGAMLAREGMAAREGLGAGDLAEEALGHAGDAYDLGSSLLSSDDDDDDDDDDAAAPGGGPSDRTRAALYRVAEPPELVAVLPPGAVDATARRFAALPGVTTPTDGGAAAVLARVRAHGGRGAVVVYGVGALTEGVPALRLGDGATLPVAALSEACREAAGSCVLLLCAPASTCDRPEAWRAAADVWGATVAAAASSPRALTAAEWARRVPARGRNVALLGGDADAVRVAFVTRRPR